MKSAAGNPLIAFAVWALYAAGAGANPTGPTVVNGQVTFAPSGNVLQVTNSPNAIINWQSFSIAASELTRFNQQSAASAVLNRVVGGAGGPSPSAILGALQSNGRVFLINPSGIVFGASAQIDVAGLVASSLSLSDADFLGGRLRFTEMPGAGAVVNSGAINAAAGGQVYLVGPSVTNGGIITAPQGEVILAAGNSVELVNPGTPNLRVEINAPDKEVLNLGQIIATSGRIGIYAGLIKSSGTLNADRAVNGPAGEILLKATKSVTLAGTITAVDGNVAVTGGSIEVASGTNFQAGPVPELPPGTQVSGNPIAGGTLTLSGGNIQGSGATSGSTLVLSNPTGTLSLTTGTIVLTNTGGSGSNNLTITAGDGSNTGSVTVNDVSIPVAAIGGPVIISPGTGAVPPTLTANNVTIPLSPLATFNLLAAPAVQAVARSTTEIPRNMSTISNVNDSTKNPGERLPKL